MSAIGRGDLGGNEVEHDQEQERVEPTDRLLQPLQPDVETSEMAGSVDKDTSGRDMSDSIALGLTWVGLGVVTLGTWVLMFTGDLSAMKWFALHPPLQTLSLVGLVLGITPLQPPTPTSSAARHVRFTSHQQLVLRLASPCLTLGTSAIWWNKHIRSAPHFTSWHAVFGMITVVWMAAQGIMGVGIAWYGSAIFGSEGKAKGMYKYHRLSGYALVLLMLMTTHLAGAYSHWAMRQATPLLRVLIYWLAPLGVVVGLGMRIQPSKMQLGNIFSRRA